MKGLIMIHILDWKYVNDGSLLDSIRGHDWESTELIADSLGITKNVLNKRLRVLKNNGLLVSYRYKDNNFIWCIGEDVDSLLNAHDAIATARYRKYIGIGGNERDFISTSAEEQENMLVDIPVFTSEKRNAYEDSGYEYIESTNHLRRVVGVEVSDALHKEVEDMWLEHDS